jgi:hypothetical protein
MRFRHGVPEEAVMPKPCSSDLRERVLQACARGKLSRAGGGRPVAEAPDRCVLAQAVACAHCRAVLAEADQVLPSGQGG